jgi:hypothetical protein
MKPYSFMVDTNVSEQPAASIFTLKNQAMWEKWLMTEIHEDED